MLGNYVDYLSKEATVGIDASLGVGTFIMITSLIILIPFFIMMCAIYYIRRTAYRKKCRDIRKQIKKEKKQTSESQTTSSKDNRYNNRNGGK